MKTFYAINGFRETPLDRKVYVDDETGTTTLDLRRDLIDHSTEFAWGYGGSGPAQLALAILANLYDDAMAIRHHQRFKGHVIAGLAQDEGWRLQEEAIRKVVDEMEIDLRGTEDATS